MRSRIMVCLLVVLGFVSPTSAQPKEKSPISEAARKELLRFQGTWAIVSQELDGKPAKPDEIKARTLFCGADVFLIRKGNELLQLGVLKIDPSKSPKNVNASVSKGLYQGEKMLGIYEISDDTLKICFDIEGQKRPADFKTAPKEGRFLAVYKRIPASAEEKDDIVGEYDSVTIDSDGKKQESKAEISRHGNAYLIKYVDDGELAYIGIALRRGDTLSVCWANRGEVGISVYRIKKDGSLEGDYTRLGGIGIVDRETLTRKKKAK
jgi:uncharacterized protein (TIGR03067 family)